MVDRALLADRIAAIRDATARIRSVLPPTVSAFVHDRTTREVVVLNMFVAIQTAVDLATHWLADAGWDVPTTYGELFTSLADHGVLERPLASRLAAASGLRNLIAHQYGVINATRIYEIATTDLADLDSFCAALAARAQ